MGFGEMLWRANVEPPTFKIGDEVLYWRSAIKDSCIITAVRTTTSLDGDETYQEIMVRHNDYWHLASHFVRVRVISSSALAGCKTCGSPYANAPRWLDFNKPTQRVCSDEFHKRSTISDLIPHTVNFKTP